MPRRFKNTIGPVIGYHGCEKAFAEQVLLNAITPEAKPKDYDWLGPGLYFWIDSPERAADWALEKKRRDEIAETAVIGAYIHLGLCLNLTDYGVSDEIKNAYAHYRLSSETAGVPLAKNKRPRDGLHTLRPLDCAVIKTVHTLRELNGHPPYDTVYGVFEEGPELFPGAGFRAKTHVQVAVINLDCIVGYFRLKG
jgi:hypothetical protein